MVVIWERNCRVIKASTQGDDMTRHPISIFLFALTWRIMLDSVRHARRDTTRMEEQMVGLKQNQSGIA